LFEFLLEFVGTLSLLLGTTAVEVVFAIQSLAVEGLNSADSVNVVLEVNKSEESLLLGLLGGSSSLLGLGGLTFGGSGLGGLTFSGSGLGLLLSGGLGLGLGFGLGGGWAGILASGSLGDDSGGDGAELAEERNELLVGVAGRQVLAENVGPGVLLLLQPLLLGDKLTNITTEKRKGESSKRDGGRVAWTYTLRDPMGVPLTLAMERSAASWVSK